MNPIKTVSFAAALGNSKISENLMMSAIGIGAKKVATHRDDLRSGKRKKWPRSHGETATEGPIKSKIHIVKG